MSRKRILLWAFIAAAAAAASQWLPVPPMSSDAPTRALTQAPKDNKPVDRAAEAKLTELPKRQAIGEPAGQLFFPHSWTPPQQPEGPVHTPAAVSKPAPPPMPYRVAGKLRHEGPPQLVLAKGDSIVTVREGDTLEDGYRVEAIHRDHVTLLYLPLRVREDLPVTWTFTIDEPLAEVLPDPAPEPNAAAGATRDPPR